MIHLIPLKEKKLFDRLLGRKKPATGREAKASFRRDCKPELREQFARDDEAQAQRLMETYRRTGDPMALAGARIHTLGAEAFRRGVDLDDLPESLKRQHKLDESRDVVARWQAARDAR